MRTLERLNKVLDKEKEYLVSGNYHNLEELIAIKEELSNGLSKIRMDAESFELSIIQKKSIRNKVLLESAQRGIKSAMLHLKEASEDTFQSYTKEGARSPLSKSMTLTQKI